MAVKLISVDDALSPRDSSPAELLRWGLLAGAAAMLDFASAFLFAPGGVMTASTRVLAQTLEPGGDTIQGYEWYYGTFALQNLRLREIAEHEKMVDAAAPAERSRLVAELAAIRQSCRDLAAEYNAKTNRWVVRGRMAPEALSVGRCG